MMKKMFNMMNCIASGDNSVNVQINGNVTTNDVAVRRRGFEKCKDYEDAFLPVRSTAYSCGYDFKAREDIKINPGQVVRIETGVKAYMAKDECLIIHIRSSLGFAGLVQVNTTGVIDADYYNNETNEGNIVVGLKNTTGNVILIKRGERIVQGLFMNYLVTDTDDADGVRKGGLGSTGR